MKKFFSVLLAEGDAELRQTLAELIGGEDDLNVPACVGSGAEALRLIDELRPDILVTGLYLTDMDGLGLLERTASLPEAARPIMLMVSPVSTPLTLRAVSVLGASYYVMDPLSAPGLVSRLRLLAGMVSAGHEDEEILLMIDELLYELCVPANLSGCKYLREGIAVAYFRPSSLDAVTKLLYPEIARRTGSTPERVERSIRCAVDAVWKRGGSEPIRKLIGPYLRGRPTNGEIIAAAARELRRRVSRNSAI